MGGRTFAIGDIHGDADALFRLLACFPELLPSDTIVFVGDYIDRGPKSKEVVDYVRALPDATPAKVVALRGNHEDAWLRVIERGWPEFTLPVTNGCLATMRSFLGLTVPAEGETMKTEELPAILKGTFFPSDVVAWMRALPYFYEDEHAIYVHAGLPHGENGFPHPSQVKTPAALLWCRDDHFFRRYNGKLVVFGHTATELLPPELSSYTPEDPSDIWAGPCTIGLDTGCGKGGFLTGLELPSLRVYESR
jgi:serine/threonine protein phosphatase 1